MLKPLQYWLLSGLAALAAVMAVANVGLYFSNRSREALVAARAQYIQQSQAIATVYRSIAGSLVKLANDHHDEELKSLLSHEGILNDAGGSGGSKP